MGTREPFLANGVHLHSIYQINVLPTTQKNAIYQTLLPETLLTRFGIDPAHPVDTQGRQLIVINATPGSSSFEISVYHVAGFIDPLFYLHMADTVYLQLEVLLLVINSPSSERFNVDRDWQGEPTKFGLLRRNLEEERRAMESGLAPGQVRRGLRVMGRLMYLLEDFAARLDHDLYLSNPLAYHNAIVQEQHGFSYIQGQRKMEWIDREFRPGGELYARLDGSTPFRQSGMEQTVRGRSWAIHDGILGEPWSALEIKMFKRIDEDAGVNTFPDAIY
jgi:hypothetical protein